MPQEWRKVIAGIYSPALEPGNHNRDPDPRYKEDPDIFVELEEGVFYQESYDGTAVPIMADYPGLLPASDVSNQETSPQKELPHCTSPAVLSCDPKGRRSAHHATPEASRKSAAPVPVGFRVPADDNMVEPSSKRYGFLF